MKLTVSSSDLLKALCIVGSIVPARNKTEILTHVLMEADNGSLWLTGRNPIFSISSPVPAELDEAGRIAVPARLLRNVIGSMSGDITLSTDATAKKHLPKLQVSSGEFKAIIDSLNADEFPRVAESSEWKTEVQLDSAQLREAISQTAFCACVDDNRPVLSGVWFSVETNRLALAAANGFVLGVKTLGALSPLDNFVPIIIPAQPLTRLVTLLGKQGEATLLVGAATARFELPNGIKLDTRLIEGASPNYKIIIPPESPTQITVDLPALANSSRHAAAVARLGTNAIHLETDRTDAAAGRLTLSAEVVGVGKAAASIDASHSGPSAKFTLNANYLAQALKAMPVGGVRFECGEPDRAVVVRPSDDESYLHVIMPMHVN